MDTHQIRLTGLAEIPSPLDEEKNVLLAGEFELLDINKRDEKDGSWKYTYKLKPVRLGQIDSAGNKIRLKTKNSNSTRLRWAIISYAEKNFPDLNSEQYYDTTIDGIIANLENIINNLKQ